MTKRELDRVAPKLKPPILTPCRIMKYGWWGVEEK